MFDHESAHIFPVRIRPISQSTIPEYPPFQSTFESK